MPDEASASRTEGCTNGQFLRSLVCAAEHKVGHIETGDQQHRYDCGEQDKQTGPQISPREPRKLGLKAVDLRLDLRDPGPLGKLVNQSLVNHGEVGLRACRTYSRLETAENTYQ